jgi:hypothetical protein
MALNTNSLNISEYIASNQSIVNVKDSVPLKIANSEHSFLIVGPPRVSTIKKDWVISCLKAISNEFYHDSEYNPGHVYWNADNNSETYTINKSDNILAKFIEAINGTETVMKKYYYFVGNVQQASSNVNVAVQPITVVGSDEKKFVDSDYRNEHRLNFTKSVVYGKSFMLAMMANLQCFTLSLNSLADIEDKDVSTTSNIEERFWVYVYQKLESFDSKSNLWRIPFGLGMVLISKSQKIIGIPYLENAFTEGINDAVQLQQPLEMEQLSFIGSNFSSFKAEDFELADWNRLEVDVVTTT